MEQTQSQPILLIGVGQGAVKTVMEVPRAAERLCVRVAGPFGVLVAGKPAGGILASSCFWLSEMSVPGPADDANRVVGGSEEALFEDICSLVRRLQVRGDGPENGMLGRTHVHAYAIVDLATAGVAPSTIRLLKLLRRADPSMEMTGVALTGRTAETGTSAEPAWCEPFKTLVADLERVHLLQRLYLLDGEDTHGTWLSGLDQMYRIGAEFILHHGMSPYRHFLRRRERTRTSLNESFLDVCGSVMCKRFSWDPSIVAWEVAATLARDPAVVGLDQGVLSQERSRALDELAQRLVEDISIAYQKEEPPVGPKTSEAPSPPVAAPMDPHEKAGAAIGQALKDVCSAQPVLSLRWFLKSLRPKLDGLAAFSRLRARWDARLHAAKALRRQAENTYVPMKEWQGYSGVGWRTPTEPFFMQPPGAILSGAVPIGYCLAAIGLMVIGLAMMALGTRQQQDVPTAIGGGLVIWSSLLTVLPTRWVERRRALVPHGVTAAERPPAVEYQTRIPMVQGVAAAVLATFGAGCLAWAIWAGRPGDIDGRTLACSGLAVAGALVGGVLIHLSSSTVAWSRKVPTAREIPDLSPPRNKPWYVAGLAVLTVAWGVLSLGSGLFRGTPNAPALLAGLAAAGLGLSLLQLPRRGSTELSCATPRMPQAPADLEEEVVEGSPLVDEAENLRSWVDRQLSVPEPPRSGDLNWCRTSLEDLLPKMFTSQWRRQLAEAFKMDLEIRSENSLRQMADDPGVWVRYLMEGLSNPGLDVANPSEAFWRYYVTRWLEEKPLDHLVSRLTLDRQSLVSAIVANVPPRWPQTREDCDVDASAIAVGKELWDLIMPFAESEDSHQFAAVDWQDRHTVAVVRIVQGLSRGWRNYPALPGQLASANGGNGEMDAVPAKLPPMVVT